MPYIPEADKDRLDNGWEGVGPAPANVGELTYALTREACRFKETQGKLRFVTIALVMGAFFCAALEFYRRVGVPYETAKLAENGDVYDDPK